MWRVRDRLVPIDRPLIFGILNVTPDSFSDGGRYESVEQAVDQAGQMARDGADGIDVGGESTRPQGAQQVASVEELRRVIPVVAAIRKTLPATILSVDTTKSDVAYRAIETGADVINDVSGFRFDPRMSAVCAQASVGVVLMHSRGGVSEMGTYRFAQYGDDVVGEVAAELATMLDKALDAGIAREAIVLDPGVGFAKRTEHSLRVLGDLGRITALGYPVMVGASRKRFVGELSGVHEASKRVAGSIGASVAALMTGARLFRVHDVAAHRQALDVAWGILRNSNPGATIDSRQPIPDSRVQ